MPGGVEQILAPAATLFPAAPFGLHAELMLPDGTWLDVTEQMLYRTRVKVGRGRSDQAAQVDRSTAGLDLKNHDGRFSPRLPTGPYYGLLGQNTPLRLWVPHTVALDSPGETGRTVNADPPDVQAGAWAADASALDITGDIDIRVDASLGDWCSRILASKYVRDGNQRSWVLVTNYAGVPRLAWSPDGTSASLVTAPATIPMPLAPGRRAVRATLDVDNGSGGWTATYYTAASLAGPWVQVGDPVTGTGVTSIFSGSAPLWAGSGDLVFVPGGGAQIVNGMQGRINALELRDGINGTTVANPDFTAQTPAAGYFRDTIASASNLWTLAGGAVLTDRLYRMHGEIAEWPPKSNKTEEDIWVSLDAAGILRRLGQGASPIQSAMRRGVIRLTNGPAVAYWPCEDESGSTSLASGLPGGQAMRFTGSPSLAASSVFASSTALPTLNGATFTGAAPSHTGTGSIQARMLIAIPAGGMPNGAVVARLGLAGGTVARLDLTYTTASSGTLTATAYDADGTLLGTSSAATGINGLTARLSLDAQPAGGLLNIGFGYMAIGGSGASTFVVGIAQTVGTITKVIVAPNGGITDTTVGHISAHNTYTSIQDLADEAAAYVGETPGRRIERLCAEEGIAFRAIGSLGPKPSLITEMPVNGMGPQLPDTLLNLLQGCAAADGGMLFEPRDVFGLGYRTRESMYNQVGLELPYGMLGDGRNPTDDDQQTRNDITVTRSGGSSARAELAEGRKSTLDPPAGVGRYDDAPTLNLGSDDQLADQAGWRLLLGTVDEQRWPQIPVMRHGRYLATNPDLGRAVLEAEVGDLLIITGMPPQLPPDAVHQLVQGYTEEYGIWTHDLTFNCSPGSPYRVAVLDDPVLGRIDTDGSELAYAVDAITGTLTVKVSDGPLWVTTAEYPSEFPFDVRLGGEVVTVTGIVGATSPQTFTVTRSVNGVVKGHGASTAVRLDQPMIIAL